ncbi:MAG TPA: peptidoglycan editing factor PgeF [Ktedonobacteraceae bacterium]|nr:peptidoglycan editing factor PgeF [Ktedonobacteraceae bacterium]
MIAHEHETLQYLQFDHYQQFPDLIHGIFTRQGGHSQAPYASLNTSTSLKGERKDSIDNVSKNRQAVLRALSLSAYPCVTLWQVHGADVATLTPGEEWRTDWAYDSYYYQTWTPQSIRQADAIITRQRGVAIALSFADCTPITFYDPVAEVIGMAHGGWRGTARGVVLATVEVMHQQFDSQPNNIYAGIGPTIGPCCYEVSTDVQDLFMGRTQFDEMPTNARYRNAVREAATFSIQHVPGKDSLRLDLPTTNRKQLLMAGLRPEHIEDAAICTACHTDRFFSHRQERGRTGRFPVVMALQTH